MMTLWGLFTGTLGHRLPNEAEMGHISDLRMDMMNMDESEIEELLRGIFAGLRGPDDAVYSSVGPQWQLFGFQNEDPRKDVRGGGLLSLKSLHSFIHDTQLRARDKCTARSDRTEGRNYPWAACAINVTMRVSRFFDIIIMTPGGASMPATGPAKSFHAYWHLLTAPNAFFTLFALYFCMFDDEFTRMGASYMNTPQVFQSTDTAFRTVLEGVGACEQPSDLLERYLAKYKDT